MTRYARYLLKLASTHVPFAWLVFAAILAFVGTRSAVPAGVMSCEYADEGACASAAGAVAEAGRISTAAAAPEGSGFEAARFDGSSWAVRHVTVQVLTDRVSERKPGSDRAFDAGASSPSASRHAAHSIPGAPIHDDAAPPRLLFYLHRALLI